MERGPRVAYTVETESNNGAKITELRFRGSEAAPLQGYLLAQPHDGAPRSVALFVHGMAEHARRYRATAERLAGVAGGNGIGARVYSYDQRGHGEAARVDGLLGFVANRDGFRLLVDDLVHVIDHLRTLHPGLPFVLLGQSMGTLVIRDYMQRYPDHAARLDAVVLSGAVAHPGLAGRIALGYARLRCRRGGARAPAHALDALTFGSYGKRFRPLRTRFDWLSRDPQAVTAYDSDPLCGFVCTNSFYVELFRAALRANGRRAVRRMPPAVPCLFISGDLDPVGGYGRGVAQAAALCSRAGMNAVGVRLYEAARHELYHETNRQEVWNDLLQWLTQIPSIAA